MKRTVLLAFAFLISTISYGQDLTSANQIEVLNAGNEIRAFSLSQEPGLLGDDPMIPAKQDQMYSIKPAIDIPITVVGAGWSYYALSKIYMKEDMSREKVEKLNANDVNGFDRWAAGNSNKTAATNSDYLFYASMPLPIILMADRKIRKDGLKVGFLYMEAVAITGLLYGSSTYFTNRVRPETYNTSIRVEDRVSGNNQNAFFAGHTALVATSTFFCAKVYSDYHPQSPWRWVFFGGAAAATGATAYLRHIAGKHFPTDQIVGITVGTLAGILVPHFHKNKNFNSQAWNIMPDMNPQGKGMGLSFNYRF